MVNKTKVHEHIVRLVQENALRASQQYVMSQTVKAFDLLLKSSATSSVNVILNNLFKMTQMQTNFGLNICNPKWGTKDFVPSSDFGCLY